MKGKTFIALILMTVAQAWATDGYFRHGYGIKYSALGGAGTALSLSPMGVTANPAELAFLSPQYEIDLGLFSPDRQYTITGNPSGYPGTFGLTPGTITSDSKMFLMPSLGAAWSLGSAGTIGAVIFANGGMNTNYPAKTFYDQSSPGTGVDLEQAFVGITYALEFVKNHALGVTPMFAYQRFAAKGLAAFGAFSTDPAHLSGNSFSSSSGFGVRVGYQGKLLPVLSLGASYQTKMSMGKFDQYKGLFAEQGGFDIPANWSVGLAAKATDRLTLAFDVQQILYSGVKSIADPLNPQAFKPLGSDDGTGFGWKDIMIYKFGVMYQASKEWTLMAGYSYCQQPIPESEVLFNILAPGVVQSHITAGVTRQFANSQELTLAFMYAPKTSVTGPNPLEAPGQQTIQISMSQWQIEIGYTIF